MSLNDNYRPQRSWGKVIFSEFCSVGEYLGRYTPRQVLPPSRYSPRAGTPPWEGPPQAGIPPGRYPPGQVLPPAGTPWAGTPPRQVTLKVHREFRPGRYFPLPSAVHAGRYGQQAGGTHPTGMQSCFQIRLQLVRFIASLQQFFVFFCSISFHVPLFVNQIHTYWFKKQECIPVGCLPSAAVAV